MGRKEGLVIGKSSQRTLLRLVMFYFFLHGGCIDVSTLDVTQ